MNEISCKLGIAFILIAFLVGCAPVSSTPASPMYWPTSGWLNATAEGQGMDSALLAQMA
jgi:type IV pilus biogenesis protein CpaD/CtpE